MRVLRLLLFLSLIGLANDPTIAADEAKPAPVAGETDKDVEADRSEAEFDQAITDFGVLAGSAYACLVEEADLALHETRVFEVANKLVEQFGTERALKFAASYGYGTAEQNDEATCVEVVDQFTDKYAVIAEKYDLVDGEEKQ